jgi:rhodanese-related sulfurtransferase
MRTTLIAILLIVAQCPLVAQSRQFVCTPCGSDCDKETYDHAGNCRDCGMTLVEKSTAEVENLSIDDMCRRISANPDLVLLDVRSPGEFKGTPGRNSYGHFKNAININIDELEGRVSELSKYKDKEIIVYCSHSHRSPRATYLLQSKGFKNVKNMAGGVSTLTQEMSSPCLKNSFIFHR